MRAVSCFARCRSTDVSHLSICRSADRRSDLEFEHGKMADNGARISQFKTL
jgi:hypothetical protein